MIAPQDRGLLAKGRDLPFRGFHYDIARGAYLKPEVFCQALRLAAHSGYTHFLPYLENMIRLPSMAKACPSCAYDAADWRRFETTARQAGIDLVPHFNVIGHTAEICRAYPELAGASAGQELDVESAGLELDVQLEATRCWTLNCLREYCQFASGEYFLIGGDEWQPPRHRLAQGGFDPGRAWAEHMNLAIDFLEQRGWQPIVWHDMLLHHPSALPWLSRKAVIAFWFYDVDADYPALATFREMGFRVLMASGLCDGLLERRRLDAVRCAVAAARRHRAEGFMITTWSDGRWEKQSFNIAAVGQILQGRDPPAPIVEALSLWGAHDRLPAEVELAQRWRATMSTLLRDSAWQAFPDLHRIVRAAVEGDRTANAASYVRFHVADGPLYRRLITSSVTPARKAAAPLPKAETAPPDFGLVVAPNERLGPVLRFYNSPERFEVYPKLGACLQDWRRGRETIIPRTIDALLAPHPNSPLPGGYRSYSRAAGFRPIWALGTHSNPCILWQHPFNWTLVEQTSDRVTVGLELELAHVAVRYHITMEKGLSGFIYRATARNKLPSVYAAFSFNALLQRATTDLSEGELWWARQSGRESTTVERQAATGFWLPVRGPLTVQTTGHAVRIDADPAQTAGYFVDWGVDWITPDIHGVYRRLAAGQEIAVQWSLRWR
jgi:hypothetical protein